MIPVFYRGNLKRVPLYWLEKRKNRAVIAPTNSVDVDYPIVIVKDLVDGKTLEVLKTMGIKKLNDSVLYMGKITTLRKLINYWMQKPFHVGRERGIGIVKNPELGKRLFGDFYFTDKPLNGRFLAAGEIMHNLPIPSPLELAEGDSEIARFGRLALSRGCPATLGYKVYYLLEGKLHESDLTAEEKKLVKEKFKEEVWFVD